MTKLYLILAAIVIVLLFYYTRHADAPVEVKIDSLITKQCCRAIDGQDTATLSVNKLKSGKITGRLLIDFFEKPKNEGLIEGTFKGDTLFVDYSFYVGEGPRPYKNPLAFLLKNDSLTLGVGQIETKLGVSYFVKGKAINFERGRFRFELAPCNETVK